MSDPAAYHRGFARLTAHTVDPLLNLVRKSRSPRLLDLGCGTGVVSEAALALGAEVTAVDDDLDMLEFTARRLPHAQVRLASLPELPYPEATFDAVAGNFVINHVNDLPAALAELHRVLRPGGTLALSWWKAGELTATEVLSAAIEAAGMPWAPPARPFAVYETPAAFTKALRAEGFDGAAVDTIRWRHRADLGAWWADVIAAGGPASAPSPGSRPR
ncbi:methyltransferase domain-containing protein [Nonomuraea sp. NBC_01738]|uniref:class I SAM-dependent methyltransferase n=1 Tax=Nonomuraea sp. NBC_01738 TaxID=2976003 RepID=UPI002E0EB234|nr:methyltransferase domain-containing protein [Nonomuraea sp. NBC_01738]